MKRVIPLILLGVGVVINFPAFSAPIGAYNQVMQTVFDRNETGLKYLVSVGVNVNAVNTQGKTALCTTVENQDYKGYELLLSQGASVYTPCMQEMDPEVLQRFMDHQPPLGTYYKGAALTASRGGVLSESAKNTAKTIFSLPYPHFGEILLAGVAVGTAFAAGVHGSGGGGSSGGKSYEAPLDLDPNTFIDTEYKDGSWKSGETAVKNIDFLGKINAANAYAHGYTGYEVSRDSNGKLVPLEGGGYITDIKVKVAVMDNGQYYNTDLYNPEQTTTSVKGLNYVYGVYNEDYNNSYYWSYAGGKATLTLNGKTTSKTVSMSQTEWDQYAGQFAPVCGKWSGSCLKISNPEADENGYWKIDYVDRVYTQDTDTETDTDPKASYYIYPEMWALYSEKYKKQDDKIVGYTYDEKNAFGRYFETESRPGSDSSHGTHVAGIIAALRNGVGMQGVAYNAEVIPIKLDLGMGESLNHISDAVDTGARIVNLSIGFKETEETPDKSHYTSNIEGKTEQYFSGLETYYESAKKGTALIFAAGNGDVNGVGLPQSSIFSAAPLVKSAYENLVINVVALGNDNTIASYSNRCGATASYCLSAPGGDETYTIVSTGVNGTEENYYTGMRGTSQATPVVSGSLAVIMGAFPFLTTQEAVQILLDTAQYIPVTDQDVINEYNASALAFDGSQDAYAKNTVEGKYNAIYGRGLVDLKAATDPIGLPKISFSTTASSSDSVTASSSNLSVTSLLSAGIKAFPQEMIVLDDYSRAYVVSPKKFVRSEKRADALRRSFRSFVARDEKEMRASEKLSFGFTASQADASKYPAGSMSMMMRPNKDVQMRFGFTADTESFGGSYLGRAVQNPFLNMRDAFGFDSRLNFAKNWALTGGAYWGKNGYIDEDIFNKMSDQSRMQLVESGVAYQGIKDVTLGISGGIMKEEDSLFGMRGAGAFDTNGAQTRFVRVMANYRPTSQFALTGTYTYGMTDAIQATSLMSFSRLTSDSFALAAEYTPDERQTFGFRFVSPLRVRSGSINLDLPVARDMYEDRLYRENYSASLRPDAREYDISLFYANDISSALSLAGEGGVRLNPEHQKSAAPDYRALFKLNWNW